MGRGATRRRSIRDLLQHAVVGEPVVVTGWVQTSRFSKNVSFVHLFDGSTAKTVQVVLDEPLAKTHKADLGVGAAVRIEGTWVPSPGGEQDVEIRASSIEIVGPSDASTYPLQKKRHTLEHLRTIAHLRPRTRLHQAIVRVRDAISWHIHAYFHEHGFRWIHTPILTASDAEGAGELFEVRAGNERDAFFGRPAYLTVSGQLQVECFAQSHTDVYTFGPTFRAENSNTPRHAAEFWMVEPEMAFADLDDVIALAEDLIRTVAQRVLADLPDDFTLFDKRCPGCGTFRPKARCKTCGDASPPHGEALRSWLEEPFARIRYDEAQAILAATDRDWTYPVGPGATLQAEHERYLAEEHFKRPVFVTNYPREQKAFYMRLDEGERTVAATDLLVPRIGELVGGSQREERLDKLIAQLEFHKIPPEEFEWYLDLRRWGSTPHGGFGLGLERMVLWLTGVQNIRDVLAFPRTPGQIAF